MGQLKGQRVKGPALLSYARNEVVVHTPTPLVKPEIIRFEPAISLYEEQLKKQEEIDKQHNAMLEKLNTGYREQINQLNNEKLELEEKRFDIERELNAKQSVEKVQEQVLKNTVKIRSLRNELRSNRVGQLELKEKEKWERLSRGGRTSSSGLEKK